jgi:hypothetical protein
MKITKHYKPIKSILNFEHQTQKEIRCDIGIKLARKSQQIHE